MFQLPVHPSMVMPPRFRSGLRNADKVGFAASFVCAVHCALLPLAVAFLPAVGLNVGGWLDFDQAFVVFASLLGGTTLAMGYRRHRAFHAWALLLPGLALVWVASFTALHDHTSAHVALMVLGGSLLAAAHLVNLRLTHGSAVSDPA